MREVPTPVDSEYAGVMTSALLIRDEEQEHILDPGLAVRDIAPVYAQDDYRNDSGSAYAVSTDNNPLIRLYVPARQGFRELHFYRMSLENADESMQRNWLRSRVRYKICRRRSDGTKDSIDYHFASDKFNIKLGSVGLMAESLGPADTEMFLREYCDSVNEIFRSERVVAGLQRFIDNRQRVVDELLIPPVKKGIA